jgi:acyl-CoA thioesterase II
MVSPEALLERDLENPSQLGNGSGHSHVSDIRYVPNSDNNTPGNEHSKRHYCWFRTNGKVKVDANVHSVIFAYMSDTGLLSTCLRSHGLTYRRDISMVVSLDHTIYFHDDSCKADEWNLFEMESPWAGKNR